MINGKAKRVRRPPTIDGMSVDEFIRRNADPIWLHANEMWEYTEPDSDREPPDAADAPAPPSRHRGGESPRLPPRDDEDLPF